METVILFFVGFFALLGSTAYYYYIKKPSMQPEPQPVPEPENPEPTLDLLTVAKANLGKHLTLNPNVSAEVGCAEAMSKIFYLAGLDVPTLGIESTTAMLKWLKESFHFKEVELPEAGAVAIAATGSGNGLIRGHVGILGGFAVQFPHDFGLLSNDSNSGLFLELWRLANFVKYYETYGGMKVRYFILSTLPT